MKLRYFLLCIFGNIFCRVEFVFSGLFSVLCCHLLSCVKPPPGEGTADKHRGNETTTRTRMADTRVYEVKCVNETKFNF